MCVSFDGRCYCLYTEKIKWYNTVTFDELKPEQKKCFLWLYCKKELMSIEGKSVEDAINICGTLETNDTMQEFYSTFMQTGQVQLPRTLFELPHLPLAEKLDHLSLHE